MNEKRRIIERARTSFSSRNAEVSQLSLSRPFTDRCGPQLPSITPGSSRYSIPSSDLPSVSKFRRCNPIHKVPLDNQSISAINSLKIMNQKSSIAFLEANPVFLDCIANNGVINPALVSNVAIKLTKEELAAFSTNLVREFNILSSFTQANSVESFESVLPMCINCKCVRIWEKLPCCEYLYCESINSIVSAPDTMVGIAYSSKSNFFSPNLPVAQRSKYDSQSMALVPLMCSPGEAFGVMQCLDFDGDSAPFPEYYQKVALKLAEFVQKKLANRDDGLTSLSLSLLYKGSFQPSVGANSAAIEEYLRAAFHCKGADLYEASDGRVVRLRDSAVQADAQLFSERKAVNMVAPSSLISIPVSHKGVQYFITLSEKNDRIAFNRSDFERLLNISEAICGSIALSKFLRLSEARLASKPSAEPLFISRAVTEFSRPAADAWKIAGGVAREMFGCSEFFLARFDGRMMIYAPSSAKVKFEECAAGISFTSKESATRRNADGGTSLAFPYRIQGKLKGAVELVNPACSSVSKSDQEVFCGVCGCLIGEPKLKE